MTTYERDTGPEDTFGRAIKEGDMLAVATNNGIRLGRVIAVKTLEFQTYGYDSMGRYGQAGDIRYGYSITINRILSTSKVKRQTFNHATLGEYKFWIVKVDQDGNPEVPSYD